MTIRRMHALALALPFTLLAGCANEPAAQAPAAEPVVTAPAAEPPAAAADPVQMSVEEVQQRLNERGYSPGTIDGQMGPRTANALRRFQRDQRLPMTGRIDEATLEALAR